jgi:hypothetical protein
MIDLLGSFEGIEDVLVFATDYPHWDADEPRSLAARLPESWHKKIFHDNAARFFGFDAAVAEVAAAPSKTGAGFADTS